MSGSGEWGRFLDELPACCTYRPLRLPRPSSVFFDTRATFGEDTLWEVGLNEWFVRVGVSWWDEDLVKLTKVVTDHLGHDGHARFADVVGALARHGVELDEDGRAWIGEQDVVVASLYSELAGAAGRTVIQVGQDLALAADAEAGDLEKLVAPLVADPDNEGGLWSDDVLAAYPEAEMAQAVILLRSVNITPVMRGHRLGAWTAAQSVALFDQGSTLVATLAAPLAKRDAIPGYTADESGNLTPQQSALWNTEQARLAEHWHAQLGLTPLPQDPTTLVWYTGYTNQNIQAVLALWDA
jgi:hypothetical protein